MGNEEIALMVLDVCIGVKKTSSADGVPYQAKQPMWDNGWGTGQVEGGFILELTNLQGVTSGKLFTLITINNKHRVSILIKTYIRIYAYM